MGMPITLEIVDQAAIEKKFEKIFGYFNSVDNRFSTYKENSEISKLNRNEIQKVEYSKELQEVLRLSEEAKEITDGYFDIHHNDSIDPSGLVKGWAIQNAARLLEEEGFKNFYVEAGGDIQVKGRNSTGQKWRVGIKNPFNQGEIIKVVGLTHEGIATSGTYIRGQHIYSPKKNGERITDIVSITVIGPTIYKADIFATAAFAMGKTGIHFLERQKGLEGYMIDSGGVATMTSGFEKFAVDK